MADVNTPPPGGFQHGGWYWDPSISQARQYNRDTGFGGGTTINNPEQQGYGQRVSEEVQRQSGYVAPQGNEIYAERGFSGLGGSTPSTINVNDIYDKLMNSDQMKQLQADVDAQEAEIQKRRKAQSEASALINDNPFYAEATRVGKQDKLDEKAYKDISNFEMAKQNAINKLTEARELAREKVNMSVTQYNIEREAANDALNKFNALLQAGALSNASADDIAGLAGATGLSSGMIYSAVAAAKKKNQNPQIIMDDNGNATIIDANTGDIISKVAGIGKREGGSGGGSMSKTDYVNYLKSDVKSGDNLHTVMSVYSGYLDPNEVLSIYNASSPYGAAKESNDYLSKRFGVKFSEDDDEL